MRFYSGLIPTLSFLLLLLVSTQPAYARKNATVFKITLPSAVINVHFNPVSYKMPREHILEWIKMSAEAVQTYYGQFPLKSANIYIRATNGTGVSGGQAFAGPTPYIRLRLGVETNRQYLMRDWVMVHEMIHLAFPKLDERHNWMTEGLAVYVESIARLQAGNLSKANAWGSLIKGMPQGLPEKGDKGLDHTPSWGRTYWGGAIFCLVADLEIRKRTKGKKGLQHALRKILKDGGNFSTYTQIEYALETGDKATGTTVLTELYKKWRDKPVDPGLNKIWKQLGIELIGTKVRFYSDADLADIRESIGKKMM